ncbi:MAG TPA: hypothetical protein VH439_17295 [Gemmatimonadales bacterium]|jgi:hypothetical protein
MTTPNAVPDEYAEPGTLFALSIWQPWATMLVTTDPVRTDGKPAKEWETRSWYPKVLPEQLAIHATKGIDAVERRSISDGLLFRPPYAGILERLGYAPVDPWAPDYEARVARWNREREDGREDLARPLPLGAILGRGRISVVYRAEKAAEIIGAERRFQEIALGNFGPDRFAWRFADVRPVAVPIPCKGEQQLWKVHHDLAAQLAAALGDRIGSG